MSKYADGDNICRWFFYAAWIVAGNVHNMSDISGMNCRRRQFMLTFTAWIVAGDDLCCKHWHELSPATIHATATIHAVTPAVGKKNFCKSRFRTLQLEEAHANEINHAIHLANTLFQIKVRYKKYGCRLQWFITVHVSFKAYQR